MATIIVHLITCLIIASLWKPLFLKGNRKILAIVAFGLGFAVYPLVLSITDFAIDWALETQQIPGSQEDTWAFILWVLGATAAYAIFAAWLWTNDIRGEALGRIFLPFITSLTNFAARVLRGLANRLQRHSKGP